jgi:hypothetical protein
VCPERRVTFFESATRRTERAPRRPVTRPAGRPHRGPSSILRDRGVLRWLAPSGKALRSLVAGVRVSFENSTVCRFCELVLCQFVVRCSARPRRVWSISFVGPVFVGEFDPGSGRTLAACLTHASRAVRPFRGYTSGERVSNTWVTCPQLWDKPGKLGLIPDRTSCRMASGGKFFRLGMGPRPISLLVG